MCDLDFLKQIFNHYFDVAADQEMSKQIVAAQPAAAFDFERVEDDHSRAVIASSNKISAWIDPSKLKLRHRIGRGTFGDVWLATHHESTEDYDKYHEVAVKMFPLIKEDHVNVLLDKLDGLFSKCQRLGGVCSLHGFSIISGKVIHVCLLDILLGGSDMCLRFDLLRLSFGVHWQICTVMKFYEGSIADKVARLRAGRLTVPDVLRCCESDLVIETLSFYSFVHAIHKKA